jgi:hypothetical protein
VALTDDDFPELFHEFPLHGYVDDDGEHALPPSWTAEDECAAPELAPLRRA